MHEARRKSGVAFLTDPERLMAYRDAAANWQFEGFVCFQLNESAHKWLRIELDDVSTRELARLIAEFIAGGGEIDEVREMRALWRDHYEFHYDLRFAIQGKPVYIETRLLFSPPFKSDESSILVVNLHDA